MKTLLIAITALILVSLIQSGKFKTPLNNSGKENSLNLNCPAPPSFTETVKTVSQKSEAGSDIDQNWYANAIENIQKTEYEISYSEELGAYQSLNRANDIHFTYHKDGFTATSQTADLPQRHEDTKNPIEIETDEKDWSIDFELSNVIRHGRSHPPQDESNVNATSLSSPSALIGDPFTSFVSFEGSEIKASGNKASIENDNIRIDYTNSKEGMRQDFIVKKKPEGDGKLRLNINADTKLKMIVGADALMFKDKDGVDKMKYSALKVWDAEGRELRAYFESNSKLGIRNYELKDKSNSNSKNKTIPNSKFLIPNSFSIVVNDENAVYPITIDPLSTNPDWTAEGNQANANFGNSVATAGDVNGDGYSDVIIGAPGYSNGESNEGAAFVFYGSATGLSLTPDWSAESNIANAKFGSSVATAGDVNGDGYSDVIIGAELYSNGQNIEGSAFAYFGSASGLSSSADWTVEGNLINARYGTSVATAGDVNGDGYSDILIGAPSFNDSMSVTGGKVYMYTGYSGGISDTAIWTAGSDQSGANFGISVSTAGDINGDGYSDIIIGADQYDNGELNEGAAFIYYGSASSLADTATRIIERNKSDARFGHSVSTAGDVNGDGYSDVIIGAYFYWNTLQNEGAVYVYQGSATGLPDSADWKAFGNQYGAQFGNSVSTAGDVNGDGYSEIIIGAHYFYHNLDGGSEQGSAFVYYGTSAGPENTAKWTGEGNQAEERFGHSVSTAGDINGDGYSDLIVGAYNHDNGEFNEGKAFVYNGFADGLSLTAGWTVDGEQYSAGLGTSLSTAGDVNGDGYSDVIISAPYYDNGDSTYGKVFVYHGSSTGLSLTSDWTAEGDQSNPNFGWSVSTAGDVNGDGFSDVIIGAIGYSNGQTNEGKAFLYLGSASGLSLTPDWTAEGDQDNANFGFSVSTAGDVNGDGYSDVIIGARRYDSGQLDEGKAFLYLGSASGLSLTPDWTAEGDQDDAYFGTSVSNAGDVNGDGYSDVIVGSERYETGGLRKGKVFVYYGSGSGLSITANWTVVGDQEFANFGYSVSTAGDVNGDGYSDVIIGAYSYSSNEIRDGKVFVYHGSVSGLSLSPDWSAEGNQDYARFGKPVSAAGDVNGDGYSDVIIGAHSFDNGQSYEGRAFLYQGSSSGLSLSPDWTAESDQTDAQFGWSVSSAGDVNGDGYSDVIVSADYFTNTQTEEGRVYVFNGNSSNTGVRSNVQQYKPGTNNVVASGGLTGTNGQVRMSIFGKSPFGRTKGKIVHEYKSNGIPFTGSNSTSSTGSGIFTNLGVLGVQLNKDQSGLFNDKEYKWRARVQYDLVSNPFQKYGPWRYYNVYSPKPIGNFRAKEMTSPVLQLNLTMFIQGFYDSGTDAMVGDTVTVYLRSSSSPYAIVDSATAYVNSSGQGSFQFSNASNGVGYYLDLRHRNSVETWSNTPQQFTAGILSYNFTSAATQAYGDNMPQINASPLRYGIYGGDFNQDGNVGLSDVISVFNAANSFTNGYVQSDMNGDNITDLSDLVITSNNANAFVGKVTP